MPYSSSHCPHFVAGRSFTRPHRASAGESPCLLATPESQNAFHSQFWGPFNPFLQCNCPEPPHNIMLPFPRLMSSHEAHDLTLLPSGWRGRTALHQRRRAPRGRARRTAPAPGCSSPPTAGRWSWTTGRRIRVRAPSRPPSAGARSSGNRLRPSAPAPGRRPSAEAPFRRRTSTRRVLSFESFAVGGCVRWKRIAQDRLWC